MLGYLSLDIICSSWLTVFLELRSPKNCLLLGTDNVRGQISEHIFAPNGDYCLYIFAPNGDYCLYYPSNLFRNESSYANWGIFSDIPQF